MDARTAILTRRSVGKLTEPGPDEPALRELLSAAVAAPDHGMLRPWRFVVLRGDALHQLGDAFAAAQARRDPSAGEAAVEATRSKALRAPVVIAVICSPKPSPKIAEWEQLAAAAAATENLCLAAHAGGWGSMWRTGWLVESDPVRSFLGLTPAERVVGTVYLGTPAAPPPSRPETDPDDVTVWMGS
jgi:nitroreductase